MQVIVPHDPLPELDTVAGPSVLYDGEDAYVSYRASEGEGGGNVVLRFEEIIDFHITPMNVDGLKDCRYPIRPWAISEVIDCEETARWKALNPRFFFISFRDETIEVLFSAVSVVGRDYEGGPRHKTLMKVLAN